MNLPLGSSIKVSVSTAKEDLESLMECPIKSLFYALRNWNLDAIILYKIMLKMIKKFGNKVIWSQMIFYLYSIGSYGKILKVRHHYIMI